MYRKSILYSHGRCSEGGFGEFTARYFSISLGLLRPPHGKPTAPYCLYFLRITQARRQTYTGGNMFPEAPLFTPSSRSLGRTSQIGKQVCSFGDHRGHQTRAVHLPLKVGLWKGMTNDKKDVEKKDRKLYVERAAALHSMRQFWRGSAFFHLDEFGVLSPNHVFQTPGTRFVPS